MSKIDELIGVYIEASSAVVWEAEKRGLCPMTLDMQRAGIAAVVRAVRDEVDKIWIDEDMGCGTILDVFNQILGDAGNEKVGTHGMTLGEVTGEMEGSHYTFCSHPATDPAHVYPDEPLVVSATGLGLSPAPAPAVCEWREISVPDGIDHYSTKHGVKNRLHLYRKDDVCPVCLAPIKFTEAK